MFLIAGQAYAHTEYGGHVYEVVVGEISWEDAKIAAETTMVINGKTCVGHLVTINSAGEQDFVHSLVSYAGGFRCWLGGYQRKNAKEPDGGWMWLSHERFSLYINWLPKEPGNFYGQDCLKMTEFGGWGTACKTWVAQSYVIEFEPRGK